MRSLGLSVLVAAALACGGGPGAGGGGGSGGSGGGSRLDPGVDNGCVATVHCNYGTWCTEYEVTGPAEQGCKSHPGNTWGDGPCTLHGAGGCWVPGPAGCFVTWYPAGSDPQVDRRLCFHVGTFVHP